MKKRRRQIFVLTPEEKKTIACVVGALALGLATRHYRATHPTPPPPLTVQQQRAARMVQRHQAAKARAARIEQVIRRPSSPVEDDED